MNHRLLFGFAALFVFVCNGLFAQKNFYLGVRAQPQFNFLLSSNDTAASRDLTFGYFGGIAVGQYFGKHFAVEIDFLYSSQGQFYTANTDPTRYGIQVSRNDTVLGYLPYTKEHRELNYLKIPAMLKYVTSRTNRVAFSGFIGFQVNILTSARFSAGNIQKIDGLNPAYLKESDYNGGFVQLDDSAATRSPYLSYKDLHTPTVVGLLAGAGVDVRLTDNLLLSANLRADYDVMDAEDKTLKARNLGSRNNLTVGVQLGVSYVFGKNEPIKGKGEKLETIDTKTIDGSGETTTEDKPAKEEKPKKEKKAKKAKE